MDKFKFLNNNKIIQLPAAPGVYTFKKSKEFLYIGKAANLKERIKQHEDLLSLATKLGYLKTDSEIEALILEANLIKKYKPKYNVVWRDDKNYFYVGITKEDYPRVFLTHQPLREVQSKKYEETKKRIFKSSDFRLQPSHVGPFVDGSALKATLKILRKIFPYRSCKNLPKRPCLWYQLSRCPAPCLLRSNLGKQIPDLETKIKKEGQKNVRNIMKILQGKRIQVITNLKKEMKESSLTQDFERAAKIRDQIMALEKVISHAKIFSEAVDVEHKKEKEWEIIQKILQKVLKTKKEISRIEAYDVSNIQGQEATGSMVTFINGQPDKNFYRKFKIKNRASEGSEGKEEGKALFAFAGRPNDIAMLKEILIRRLAHSEWKYPDLILIDGGKAQLNAALQCSMNLKFISRIKIMALAKKHNELFVEGRKEPISLKKLPRKIFNLILQLRDEAHRFALSYHKKLRKKKLIGG